MSLRTERKNIDEFANSLPSQLKNMQINANEEETIKSEETQTQTSFDPSQEEIQGRSSFHSMETLQVEENLVKAQNQLKIASKTTMTFDDVIKRSKQKKADRNNLESKNGSSFGTFNTGSRSGGLTRSLSEKRLSLKPDEDPVQHTKIDETKEGKKIEEQTTKSRGLTVVDRTFSLKNMKASETESLSTQKPIKKKTEIGRGTVKHLNPLHLNPDLSNEVEIKNKLKEVLFYKDEPKGKGEALSTEILSLLKVKGASQEKIVVNALILLRNEIICGTYKSKHSNATWLRSFNQAMQEVAQDINTPSTFFGVYAKNNKGSEEMFHNMLGKQLDKELLVKKSSDLPLVILEGEAALPQHDPQFIYGIVKQLTQFMIEKDLCRSSKENCHLDLFYQKMQELKMKGLSQNDFIELTKGILQKNNKSPLAIKTFVDICKYEFMLSADQNPALFVQELNALKQYLTSTAKNEKELQLLLGVFFAEVATMIKEPKHIPLLYAFLKRSQNDYEEVSKAVLSMPDFDLEMMQNLGKYEIQFEHEDDLYRNTTLFTKLFKKMGEHLFASFLKETKKEVISLLDVKKPEEYCIKIEIVQKHLEDTLDIGDLDREVCYKNFKNKSIIEQLKEFKEKKKTDSHQIDQWLKIMNSETVSETDKIQTVDFILGVLKKDSFVNLHPFLKGDYAESLLLGHSQKLEPIVSKLLSFVYSPKRHWPKEGDRFLQMLKEVFLSKQEISAKAETFVGSFFFLRLINPYLQLDKDLMKLSPESRKSLLTTITKILQYCGNQTDPAAVIETEALHQLWEKLHTGFLETHKEFIATHCNANK